MTKKSPHIGDDEYDPSKDELFLDQVQPPPTGATLLPGVGPGPLYKGTDKTAQELVDLYGYGPDGTPRTEAAPDTPSCPVVSPDGYPFDTTTIPAGLGAPLSPECVDFYNTRYAPTP
jgi:hypothetical protein